MRGIIGIDDLKVRCIIGCGSLERKTPQDILLDLKVSYDFSSLKKSEELSNTIDYVALSDVCIQLASENKFKLIETLANEIVQKLLIQFPIDGVWIRVKKASGLKSASYAYVELKKGNI